MGCTEKRAGYSSLGRSGRAPDDRSPYFYALASLKYGATHRHMVTFFACFTHETAVIVAILSEVSSVWPLRMVLAAHFVNTSDGSDEIASICCRGLMAPHEFP